MAEERKQSFRSTASEIDVKSVLISSGIATEEMNQHHPVEMSSDLDINSILPKVEASHLRNVSNAQEIAEQFNLLLQEEDMEPPEIVEDLGAGAIKSALMDNLENKMKEQWSSNKRSTIHHNLHQAVTHHFRSHSQPQITPESSAKSDHSTTSNPRHTQSYPHSSNHLGMPFIASPRDSNPKIVSQILGNVVRSPRHTKGLSSIKFSLPRRFSNNSIAKPSTPPNHHRVNSDSQHTLSPIHGDHTETTDDIPPNLKSNGLLSPSATAGTVDLPIVHQDVVDGDHHSSDHLPTAVSNDLTAPNSTDSADIGTFCKLHLVERDYKSLSFDQYTAHHLAQFLADSTRNEFESNGSNSALRSKVFSAEIDGATLKRNLNGNFIKKTFETEEHKFKKCTQQYLIQCGDDGTILEQWDCSKVFEFLYFAESQVVQRAIIELEIDGARFAAMDFSEFKSTLNTKGIKTGMAREYFQKLDEHRNVSTAQTVHKVQSAAVQPVGSKSNLSLKPFIEYTADEVTQCLHQEVRAEFESVGKDDEIYSVVTTQQIDGKLLMEKLNEEFIKKSFEKRFKKATIHWIIDSAPSTVDASWTCDQVAEWLYFAECAVVNKAILELELDGKTLAAMDSKEFKGKLKGKSIKSPMATKYWDKIVSSESLGLFHSVLFLFHFYPLSLSLTLCVWIPLESLSEREDSSNTVHSINCHRISSPKKIAKIEDRRCTAIDGVTATFKSNDYSDSAGS